MRSPQLATRFVRVLAVPPIVEEKPYESELGNYKLTSANCPLRHAARPATDLVCETGWCADLGDGLFMFFDHRRAPALHLT